MIDIPLQNGSTALMMTSKAGHIECVKMLLEKGAEINMPDNVSDVIIHCVHTMPYVPRVPSSE